MLAKRQVDERYEARRRALVAEATLHEIDSEDGQPLVLGLGVSIAMHSARCGRCAKAAITMGLASVERDPEELRKIFEARDSWTIIDGMQTLTAGSDSVN